MFLKFYTPHPLLKPFVSSIMLFAEQFADETSLQPIPYPPIPEQSLFFYPRTRILSTIHGSSHTVANPTSIIVGPQLKRVNIVLGKDHLVIRVGFKPGALQKLVRIPMNEIVDIACDTADFFSHEVRELNEQLFNTTGYDNMIAAIEQFLIRKFDHRQTPKPFDYAMQELLKRNGALPIEQAASLACISPRQFERQCLVLIGLQPKLFSRLIRFSSAYRLFEARPMLRWTHISHTCGYFDQMHFIRDCKEFAGVTPSAIAKEVSHAPAHLQYMLQL